MIPMAPVVYSINLGIALILAVLLTQYWRDRTASFDIRDWIVAAWVLTVADLLFALRELMPYWSARFFPTLLVTVGHGLLLSASRRTGGASPRPRLIGLAVLIHAGFLAYFLATDAASSWRTVVNGAIWGPLSAASAYALWTSRLPLQRLTRFTAVVFVLQGLFHAYRTALALQLIGGGTPQQRYDFVQVLGDVEVSFFMVALFVSVLVAYLRLGNQELREALADVQQLSGMLPICAWCHNVRDDQGYWTKIEQYFKEHHVEVTHSICESCQQKHFAGEAPSVTRP